MKIGFASVILSLTSVAIPSQAATFIVPTVVVAVLADDNILISADDRQKDVITRVSPGVETGYESERLLLRGSYSQDLESHRDNPDLDSSSMRRYLDSELAYRLSELAVLSVNANYNQSRVPSELNIITGAGEGRMEGERASINPAISYRFSPRSSGQIDFTHTRDRLAGGVDGNTNAVNVEYEHGLNINTQMTYGYTYTHFAFDNPEAGVMNMREHLHTPRIGIFRDINEFTNVTVQVGPTFTADDVGVNVGFLLQRRYSNGLFILGYNRGSTSLIGEPGLSDMDAVNASMTHDFSNRFGVHLTASYSEVRRDNMQFGDARIARASVDAIYRINSYASISASYSYSEQRTSRDEANRTIPRGVAMLAMTFTYPRRSEPVVFAR